MASSFEQAVVVVGMWLLAAGCGSAVSGAPASPAVADASRVDMCTISRSIHARRRCGSRR